VKSGLEPVGAFRHGLEVTVFLGVGNVVNGLLFSFDEADGCGHLRTSLLVHWSIRCWGRRVGGGKRLWLDGAWSEVDLGLPGGCQRWQRVRSSLLCLPGSGIKRSVVAGREEDGGGGGAGKGMMAPGKDCAGATGSVSCSSYCRSSGREWWSGEQWRGAYSCW